MRIHVVSTARAEFNHCLSISKALAERELKVTLIMTGSHLAKPSSKEFSDQYAGIEFLYLANNIHSSDFADQACSLSTMLSGFGAFWEKCVPDAVVFVGDRYELMAPVTVASLMNVVIIHAYGGECDVSYCIDTRVRNAVTSLSHLHFVSHDEIKKRLVAYGEESWRIHSVGNVALSCLNESDKEQFENFAINSGWGEGPFIAACYLPSTTVQGATETELSVLLEAVGEFQDYTFIWAGVNSDPGSGYVRRRLVEFCSAQHRHFFVENLGATLFFGLCQTARCLVGNSSSGFLEAASFKLPVVNVGTRQVGRLSGSNVQNVPTDVVAIKGALDQALGPEAQTNRDKIDNPFYVEKSAELMASIICESLTKENRDKILLKRYVAGNPDSIGSLRRCKE